MRCSLRGAAFWPCQRRCRILLCWALLSVVGVLVAQSTLAAPDLQYQSKAQAAIVRWTGAGASPIWSGSLSSDTPLLLNHDEVLIVPARVGEQFRVRSRSLLNAGWGSGAGATPDAISWVLRGARDPTLRLAAWGSARFLVVATAGQGAAHVRVERAAPKQYPMELYRLDRAVQRWLSSEGAELPPAPSEHFASIVRSVAAYRRLLTEGAPEAASGDWVRHWLQSRWLDGALHERPLRAPFFRPWTSQYEGGVALTTLAAGMQPEETDATRLLEAGQSLTLHPSGEDLVVFSVKLRATARAQFQLLCGDTLLEQVAVTMPSRSEDPNRWTLARLLRARPRGTIPLTLKVVAGQARVVARSYHADNGLLDPTGLRQVGEQLALARSKLPRASSLTFSGLRSLLDYEISPTAERLRRLYRWGRDPRLAPALRLLLLDAALPSLLLGQHGRDAFRRYAELSTQQDSRVSGSLQRAAYLRLLRVLYEPFPEAWTPAPVPQRLVSNWTDADVAALLFGQIWAPSDGERPFISDLGEQWAALNAAESERTDWVRGSWRRAAPWKLDAAPGRGGGRHGPRGLRWTLLNQAHHDINVSLPGGSHASVRWMSPPEKGAQSSEWTIDGITIRVHAGVGSSYTALKPGRHRFSRLQGAGAHTAGGTRALRSAPRGRALACH